MRATRSHSHGSPQLQTVPGRIAVRVDLDEIGYEFLLLLHREVEAFVDQLVQGFLEGVDPLLDFRQVLLEDVRL